MSTDSTQLPSDSSHRYLMVPSSRDTYFLATWGGVRKAREDSFSRSALDRSVISSKEETPRYSQWKICLARKAGSPCSFSQAVSPYRVMDLM